MRSRGIRTAESTGCFLDRFNRGQQIETKQRSFGHSCQYIVTQSIVPVHDVHKVRFNISIIRILPLELRVFIVVRYVGDTMLGLLFHREYDAFSFQWHKTEANCFIVGCDVLRNQGRVFKASSSSSKALHSTRELMSVLYGEVLQVSWCLV